MRKLACIVSVLASALSAFASSSVVGIALLRELPWSPPTQISDAVPFTSFEDHTGYYIFTLLDQTKERVDVGLVVQWITVPSVDSYPNILSSQDILPISQTLNQLLSVTAKVYSTKSTLAPVIEKYQSELLMFGKGNKKVEGRWISDSDYKQMQAAAQSEQLKEAADSQREQASRDANAALGDLRSSDLDTSEEAIAKLEELKDLNKSAGNAVSAWNREQDMVSNWKAQVASLLEQIKNGQRPPFFRTFSTVNDLCATSPDLQESLAKLDASFQQMKNSMQYPQILKRIDSEYQTVRAIQEIATIVSKVKQRDIPGALSQLNNTVETQSIADPLVISTLTRIKGPLDTIVAEAEQHQEEGKELEESGKTSAAIKEYQASIDLIKNDDISEKIKQLRNDSLVSWNRSSHSKSFH